MTPELKDLIQVISWSATAIGVVVATIKLLTELRSNRKQRTDELNQRKEALAWRRAEAAKKLNDEMLEDPEAFAAMQMIDSHERQYILPSRNPQTISTPEWVEALRGEMKSVEKDQFIRDCFDSLAYYFATFEHYIDRGLILRDDVDYPLSYYIGRLRENRRVIEEYLERFEMTRASRYLRRHPRS